MRKCPYCGAEYADDVAVCIIDGESLAPPPKVFTELPVNEEEKEWIEQSFQWLLENFGKDTFLKHKTILPETTFFPDKYDGSEHAVDLVVKRVCGYMDVNPNQFEVEFLVDRPELTSEPLLGDRNYSGAAGLYIAKDTEETQKKVVLNVALFQNPTRLVGTIAHELGHVILLGGGKITKDREDHELLTDLLTVFLGLGIFTANCAFQFSQWQDNRQGGWSASRMGYMTEGMYGYSLAAYSWMRNDKKPAWSKHLNMNVSSYLKDSLEYFEEGGPTTLGGPLR
jgi:hypothetical protein